MYDPQKDESMRQGLTIKVHVPFKEYLLPLSLHLHAIEKEFCQEFLNGDVNSCLTTQQNHRTSSTSSFFNKHSSTKVHPMYTNLQLPVKISF